MVQLDSDIFFSIPTKGPEGMFPFYIHFMYTTVNSSLKATKNTDLKKVTEYQGQR